MFVVKNRELLNQTPIFIKLEQDLIMTYICLQHNWTCFKKEYIIPE